MKYKNTAVILSPAQFPPYAEETIVKLSSYDKFIFIYYLDESVLSYQATTAGNTETIRLPLPWSIKQPSELSDEGRQTYWEYVKLIANCIPVKKNESLGFLFATGNDFMKTSPDELDWATAFHNIPQVNAAQL